jgi:hypothetical protein
MYSGHKLPRPDVGVTMARFYAGVLNMPLPHAVWYIVERNAVNPAEPAAQEFVQAVMSRLGRQGARVAARQPVPHPPQRSLRGSPIAASRSDTDSTYEWWEAHKRRFNVAATALAMANERRDTYNGHTD